jgi:hypothetical protein
VGLVPACETVMSAHGRLVSVASCRTPEMGCRDPWLPPFKGRTPPVPRTAARRTTLRRRSRPINRSGLLCADRGPHRAELLSLASSVIERGTCVGIYRLALLDVREPQRDQLPRMLSLQESASYSAGPQIDVALAFLRYRLFYRDVRDLKSAARP